MEELHELEQEKQDEIPEVHEVEGDVSVERIIGDEGNGSLPIVSTDGDYLDIWKTAFEKRERARTKLLDLLLPVDIYTNRRGKIQIRRNTKLFYEPKGTHIKLEEADVNEAGRLFYTFVEVGQRYPRRSWTFRTVDLAHHFEDGDLLTQKEIDENAREALGV